MARTKKTVVSGISREQAEQAFADFGGRCQSTEPHLKNGP